MIPLYTQKEFNEAKGIDYLLIQCYGCGAAFNKQKKEIKFALKSKNRCKYCSLQCKGNYTQKNVELCCTNCGSTFLRKLRVHKQAKNNQFCSSSCSATYNNKHKSHGTRRSKLEVWLEEQLTSLYPDLEIHYNQKEAIKSELDIYIPSLKLAFELNGIFHYEPIFGEDKLSQIQNNDQRKFQACLENGVELVLIDSSGLKYFKPQKAKKYLDIITEIVNKK